MKVIDLLNKIANGEEVPKKIKYLTSIYTLRSNNNYYVENSDSTHSNGLYYQMIGGSRLNDEVEIIEAEIIEEDKKIERITNEAFLNSPFGELVGGKFNEIIDALNEMSERLNETYNDRTELKNEVNRLNNIINESAEEILKELEENHHLSYGVALAIRQKLLDYKELKGSDKD